MTSSSSAPARCYLASPLGFTEAGRHYYHDVFVPALSAVVVAVDPWSLTTEAEIMAAAAQGSQRAMALEIGRRNIAAIESCRLLVAHLDGQEVDAGTAAEVGFAAARGLRCFGLRTDIRQAGELGVSVNLQVETFIVESGGKISNTLAALLSDLRSAPARS